jgi:hypothetical protein
MKSAIFALFLFAPLAHADQPECFSLPENNTNAAQICLQHLNETGPAISAEIYSDQNELIDSVAFPNLEAGEGSDFHVNVKQTNLNGTWNTTQVSVRPRQSADQNPPPGQGNGGGGGFPGRFGSSGEGTQCNPGHPSHC